MKKIKQGEPTIRIEIKEISKISKYILSLVEHSHKMEEELHHIQNTIEDFKTRINQLEKTAQRLQNDSEESRLGLTQLLDFFMKKIEEVNPVIDSQSDQPTEVEQSYTALDMEKETGDLIKPNFQEKTVIEAPAEPLEDETYLEKLADELNMDREFETTRRTMIETNALQGSISSAGVMLFISPAERTSSKSYNANESTCLPRRQLVPTLDEEKMILDYLIRMKFRPSQKEYNRLYKAITYMLINAPKNAIAIQIRAATTSDKKRCIESFYHIQTKDGVNHACFKYIEIKGVPPKQPQKKEPTVSP